MYGDELVIFPDVTLALCDFLRDALADRTEPYCDGVLVTRKMPAGTRPARAVIVRSDGGRRASAVHRVERVGLNIWASDEQEASDLGRMVAALLTSAAPTPIEHVEELASFTPIDDESGQPRRYGTFAVTVAPAIPGE